MKKIILITSILFLFVVKVSGQINYSLKAETGFLKFQTILINVDPGPNWKGYNLNKKQNGVDINIINGLNINSGFFAGIGLGYLNFEGINGLSIFTDFDYLPLKTKLTPIINLKIGYNHIWNQYENGTESVIFELAGGLNYKVTKRLGIYLQSGIMSAQQSFFIPIRLGVRL